jgi:two-component system, OmpR family, alkaline phosphatase synthesis response regulator PhoP
LNRKNTQIMTEIAPAKKKILIVDDEEDILEFLSYHFKKSGYEVFTQLDGMGALAAAYKELPNVIISDIRMPIMDGIELCKTMKTDERLKQIPLLFLTADDGDYIALLAHECGADFYLNKPVRIDVISRVVNSMINSKIIN